MAVPDPPASPNPSEDPSTRLQDRMIVNRPTVWHDLENFKFVHFVQVLFEKEQFLDLFTIIVESIDDEAEIVRFVENGKSDGFRCRVNRECGRCC